MKSSSYLFLFFSIGMAACSLVGKPSKPSLRKQNFIIESAKAEPEKKQKMITIFNKIDRSTMLRSPKTYNKIPSSFVLQVNGKELPFGSALTIPLNKPFTVRYDYSFWGFKKGAKEIVFEPTNDAQTIELTFSWDKEDPESKVLATHAIKVKGPQEVK